MGPKVVIIGAGIAGLTAALAMASKGLDAEIYEQAPELKEVGAGVGLWGNAFPPSACVVTLGEAKARAPDARAPTVARGPSGGLERLCRHSHMPT
jgi:heterodisulfide reductase subunit A-like polyferredoxin